MVDTINVDYAVYNAADMLQEIDNEWWLNGIKISKRGEKVVVTYITPMAQLYGLYAKMVRVSIDWDGVNIHFTPTFGKTYMITKGTYAGRKISFDNKGQVINLDSLTLSQVVW